MSRPGNPTSRIDTEMPPRGDVDPWCDEIGRCEGQESARPQGICSCTHCGKELHFRDGHWWTWDARFYDHPQPQHELSDLRSR